MYTDNQRYQDICTWFKQREFIEEILRVVKEGKEGSVLLCKGGRSIDYENCAVKIFKDPGARNFKNDHEYLEGKVWKRRDLLHIEQLKHDFWAKTEFATMEKFYNAGLPVPRPWVQSDTAICMEFIGHGDEPASILKHAPIRKEDAPRIFRKLIDSIDKMLSMGIVHGDLSPFNILYHNDEPVIIDFPQAVSANANSNAYALFRHDIDAVCCFFKKFGFGEDGYSLADEIWKKFYRF